jgi:hypothetical protein
MVWFVLTTQVPDRRTNWVAPRGKVAKRGATTRDAWWYASKSRAVVERIRAELLRINPRANPPIRTTIRTLATIPAGYQ